MKVEGWIRNTQHPIPNIHTRLKTHQFPIQNPESKIVQGGGGAVIGWAGGGAWPLLKKL